MIAPMTPTGVPWEARYRGMNGAATYHAAVDRICRALLSQRSDPGSSTGGAASAGAEGTTVPGAISPRGLESAINDSRDSPASPGAPSHPGDEPLGRTWGARRVVTREGFVGARGGGIGDRDGRGAGGRQAGARCPDRGRCGRHVYGPRDGP